MGTRSRYIFSFWAFVAKGLVALTILKNDTVPKRGEGLKISCLTSPHMFTGDQTIYWDYPTRTSATVCFVDGYVCTGTNRNYNFTADNNGAYATIYSLDRLRDSGTWTCIGSDNLGTNNTVVIVYTSPKGVKYVQPIVSEADLGQESINLICLTDNCTYPSPSILWFYLNNQQQKVRYDVSDGVMVNNTTPCDQLEAIYTSTLHLTRGTTFQGNIPFKTKFVCGVQHSALGGGIQYSEPSNYINFAVNLTSVTLKDMSDNALPSTLELVQGSVVILKCVTSTSRPTATVRWYIGSTNVISGVENVAKPGDNGLEFMESNLTFTPNNNEHHNKYIYCQAYSSVNSSFLQSTLHMLFVKVQVPNITVLYDDTSTVVGSKLPVVNGTSITLRCETGPSRPASIIVWYKGNVTVQGGVIRRNESNGGLDRVISILTFKPSNNDHDMELFCQGYNIDPKDTVTSTKAILNVTVYVSRVTLIPGNSSITFLEGDQMIIKCVTSPSRPRPQIRWWVSNEIKTDNIKESISNSGNLIIMESEITLMLNRSYKNRLLYCDTQVPEQGTWISSFKSQTNVWYTPKITFVPNQTSVTVNETRDLHVTCISDGNPTPSVEWSNIYSSNVLYIRNVCRHDSRTYVCIAKSISTNYGHIPLQSQKQLQLTVQFAPEMSVKVTPSIVEVNSEVRIECSAHGEPSSYTFYDWIHKLGNMKLRHIEGIVENQSTLAVRLPNITIADMGTYICSVDNGIPGPNGDIVQSVEAQIDITGIPVAFVRDTFLGEINMSASIKIPFFSNPNITAVEFFRTQNNTPVANDTDTQVYHTEANISTVFHNTDVVLQGMEAVIHFRSLKESDFGQYTLVLSNNMGNATLSVHLNATAPPTPVKQFYFYRLLEKYIEFYFVPGFNGGYQQTFTIQLKPSGSLDESWKNTSINGLSEMDDTYKLPNGTFLVQVEKLQPGSYVFRMFSVNEKNIRTYSQEVPVYIEAEGTPKTLGIPVAAIAGGVSAGFVLILVMVLGIFLWRRSQQKKQNEDENDVIRKHKERSVRHSAANGQEYEGLHLNRGEASPYLQLNDIRLEENRNANTRPPENDSYEKLHPYTNSDIQMYSSLKIPKISKDSEQMYENTQIK